MSRVGLRGSNSGRRLRTARLQGLAALRLGLASARRTQDLHAVDQAVAAAVEQLDAEIASLRSLIAELRPAALDQLGIGAAIDALAARTRAGGMRVDVDVDLAYEHGRESVRHVGELETAVYRITQEALTNARRHRRATRASVHIVETKQAISLSVRDDGDGFDPAAPAAGFGVLGMRERAELVGGRLSIRSAPGQGTAVEATLPVRRRPPQPGRRAPESGGAVAR